ncbi:MAG: tellurite resistance protein TerB [Alphaproteobacteria bacterium]|jgi:tellurite resistance protein TerB
MLEALRQGMGRHQCRAFWEATIAVCALVAAPEGRVSFATRIRIDHILDSLPDLKVFNTNEFVETFDRFVEEFRVSPGRARSRALDVARKGANDIDEAELLARIALAVADPDATTDLVDLEPIKVLCGELGVDPITVLAAVSAPQEDEVPTEPAASVAKPPPHLKTVEVIVEEEPKMPDDQTPEQESENIAMRSAGPDADVPSEPATAPAPVVSQNSGADLSQQLAVDGTKAVIALCGRTKTGALEALRIYENEQFAAADCALSEKIANEKFWLSPVTLFPSGAPGGASAADGEPTPIHVLCLSRPDGSVEALRAFESADNAGADLEFFRNISNDKMWVSVVQFKTVT